MKIQQLKKVACLSALCLVGSAFADSTISISVQGTEMRNVLKFISEQSGTSIVISPDVSTKTLDINLQDVELSEALDVILKPYGCGYRKVGSTVVVDKLENLHRLSEVEPLVSKVVKLKYLDAKGVVDIVDAMLSERGSVKMLTNTQKLGWEFADASGDENDVGKLERQEDGNDSEGPSSTLVITETPSTLTRIQEVIAEIDVQPRQVDIRSYFVEFTDEAIKDIGVSWGLSDTSGGLLTGVASGSGLINEAVGTDFSSDESGNGMKFGLIQTGKDGSIGATIRALQANEGVNVLSAPRILAQENQEASILIGEKYPVITSETDDENGNVTISLDYYERIGIQLNVIPQICDGDRINMVIHPMVSEENGTVDASIIGQSDTVKTPYLRIKMREAETRLTVDNGQTVAIGGLVDEKEVTIEDKVPLLGDIPMVGKLFRRDRTENEKQELVILMTAQIKGDGVNGAALNQRIDQSQAGLLDQWKSESDVVTPAE